jgi:3-oxoadipate enol-lactonase
MKTANIDGITLEYDIFGKQDGEPVLMISPVLADGFLPLTSERALSDKYRLVTYHRRGWAGSTRTPGEVSIADHATDAAGLLAFLGIKAAHVVGHSSGAAVALELAIRRPANVASLGLLEPSLLTVPAADGFFAAAKPAFDAYAAGRYEDAFAAFMTIVSGLEWPACRELLDRRIPGCVAQSVKDADTFFGVELPALMKWRLDEADAKRIQQPALSILGSKTQALWVEVAERLRAWLPNVEECRVSGVGHLLHIQRSAPVADALADFLAKHALPVVA